MLRNYILDHETKIDFEITEYVRKYINFGQNVYARENQKKYRNGMAYFG